MEKISKNNLMFNGKYPIIHYADLYKFAPIQKKVFHYTNHITSSPIPKNSLLFPGSDVTPDGLARTSTMDKENIYAGGDIIIANLSSTDIKSKFLTFEINYRKDRIIPLITGTTIRHLHAKELQSLPINYPDLSEQNKIGQLLSKLDDTITLLQRKKSKYEYLKTALFQNLFPEKNQVIPNLRRKEFNENWKKENLGKLVNLRGRIGFRGYKEEDLVDKNKGALVLSPADIKDNGRISNKNNKYISWYKYNESPEIKVKKNDIIFTKTASIGKIAYLEALNGPTTINPQLVLITPIKISSFYLYLYLNTDVFKRIIKGISGGSSVQTISQEELKEQNIYFPNNVEQEKINKIISNLDNIIVKLDTKIIDLNKFKQFLLQNMFI